MNPREPHYPNRADWLVRPARKQVDDATLQREIQARGGLGERNLWSGRRIGPSVGPPGSGDGKRGGQRGKDASKYRCVVEVDAGRTRGSDAKQHVFCLYFTKGCCSQGSACTYLHRLPTAEDEAYTVKDLSADIFGREKRAESEGYRSGAGTLDRDNRTLYVNYEGAGAYDLPKIRQLLDANFRLFGPVNNIYIVHTKTIAFVRYDWRSSAEFAKEAMHKQGLVGSSLGEVLTVRWANEDPNPVAVLAQKRACEEAFGLAVTSSFEALPPEQKQARIMELQLQSAIQKGTAIGAYPVTEDQFAERERQQMLLLQQQQQQQAAAEEEEDIPYIPVDIYEEQQRLIAQRQNAGAGQAPASAPTLDAAHRKAQALGQSDTSAAAEPGGEMEGVRAAPDEHGFGSGPSVAAGVTGEAPEWERAWADPELREQMRANPELRERMRRARNEAVYWSAYQAHYSAYANSYGHQTTQEEQQQYLQYPQSEACQQQEGQDAGYGWQDYAYYGWYGQQGVTGEPGTTEQAVAATWAPTGYGAAAAASAGEGIVGDHDREEVGRSGQGEVASVGQREGLARTAGDHVAGNGTGDESGSANRRVDGLSLLGAAYGSDGDEED